jgi:hypothetical protein
MYQGEIAIYKDNLNSDFQMEVRVEKESVWLNRLQLAELFDRDVKTIGKHIANSLKEELQGIQVIAKFATTASDGKTYQVEHYNLDMIISVGYRVKSNRGVQFRIWAGKILKSYLLKGYALNDRLEKIEKAVDFLKAKSENIDFLITTGLPPNQGVFYDGQIFDAHAFVSRIIKSAKQSIHLIDNYVDESVLILLSKRDSGVTVKIYTKNITKQLQLDLDCFNKQYEPIELKEFSKSHDRFLIIDQNIIYHIGASLKVLVKKWFAFSKLNIDSKEIISKL